MVGILADDEAGEPAAYKREGEADRPIQIYRENPEQDNWGSTPINRSTVWVMNSATLGISSAELNRGRDLLNFSERPGLAGKDRVIQEISTMNPSFMEISFR